MVISHHKTINAIINLSLVLQENLYLPEVNICVCIERPERCDGVDGGEDDEDGGDVSARHD